MQRIKPPLPSLILMLPQSPRATLFPYTTLFRSLDVAFFARMGRPKRITVQARAAVERQDLLKSGRQLQPAVPGDGGTRRSEEHTSELQSQSNLVCRLLLEKKK